MNKVELSILQEGRSLTVTAQCTSSSCMISLQEYDFTVKQAVGMLINTMTSSRWFPAELGSIRLWSGRNEKQIFFLFILYSETPASGFHLHTTDTYSNRDRFSRVSFRMH